MRNKIIIAFIAAFVAIVILLIVLYYKKSTRNAIETFIQNNKMINILVAGSNVYNNNRNSFYAILTFNSENNKIGITFIPPEFKIDPDGKGENNKKIGEMDFSDFNYISESIERDLKLNIPFYVVLYSPDVERLVDLIEGVELYVLDDKLIHGIKFGLNYFAGDKIVQYINSVPDNSIYRKYDRIQDIILTLFYNQEKYSKYFNLEFISEILKAVKTNLLPQEVLSLSKLLVNENTNLICTIVPGFVGKKGLYRTDDAAYKIYKNNFLKNLVVDSDAEQVKVNILNGTDVTGLARKIRYKFITQGFSVLEFGTAPYSIFDHTVIINRRGNMSKVKKISKLLGTNKVYHIIDNSQLTDVMVIIGTDLVK